MQRKFAFLSDAEHLYCIGYASLIDFIETWNGKSCEQMDTYVAVFFRHPTVPPCRNA
jgi:hypothetical protein